MKCNLPFSQVAILSPELVFSQPQNPDFDRQMQAELQGWYALARARGADAVYARVQQAAAAPALLRALVHMGARLLAPAGLYDPSLAVCAWHASGATYASMGRLHGPSNALLGISCHRIADLRVAERDGFDYAFLSPIFATATHPEAQPLGLDLLAQACNSVALPVIALGGIDFGNAAACRKAGAAGWAGIRCWM
jgi:thiamine-phosphate pyrophosphorylase